MYVVVIFCCHLLSSTVHFMLALIMLTRIRYGPTFADYFEEQNDHQRSGLLPPSTLEVRLESVGIST